MNKIDAINFYKIVKDSFSDLEANYNDFFEYFESTWLSLDNNCKSNLILHYGLMTKSLTLREIKIN